MTGQYKYSIVRIADRRRGEILNAGVVIFNANSIDVRLPRKLDKLRALSGALDVESLRYDLESLVSVDSFVRSSGGESVQERLDMFEVLTPFSFSEVAVFEAHNADAYEASVLRLLRILVEPELPPARLTKKRTKLSSAFKAALKAERVLARKGEGLAAHRVVSNVQIAEGLAADFVLKNGAMHVIETVDASSDEMTLRKVVTDIAVSALVLEQARMTFGANETKGRLVYDASASIEKFALPSLEAAAHQGAELVNWASLDDRNRLLVDLASLASPFPTKREEKWATLHASTQSKFLIN